MINQDLGNLLLNLAPVIVSILQGKANIRSNIDFRKAYCKSNCGSPSDDPATQHILQMTYDFALASGYCDCDRCDKTKGNYYEEFKAYIDSILPHIFANLAENLDLDCDFNKDYQNTLESLLNGQITLEKAQDSLKCWLGVLTEAQLQNELVRLTYTYIRKLNTKHL